MATSSFLAYPPNQMPFKFLINGRYSFVENTKIITKDNEEIIIKKGIILTVDNISNDGNIVTLRWIDTQGKPPFPKYYIEATKEKSWISYLRIFTH